MRTPPPASPPSARYVFWFWIWWCIALLLDATSTMVAVLVTSATEANPLPALIVRALRGLGPIGAHVATICVLSFVATWVAHRSITSHHWSARAWRTALILLAGVKIGAAIMNLQVLQTMNAASV